MRVLLFTSPQEDYLGDSILHGFKSLCGRNAIAFPEKDSLYNDHLDFESIRGNGFTLYGTLDKSLKIPNQYSIKDILEQKFDLVVFTSIYRQYKIYYKYYKVFSHKKTPIWFFDGEDTDVIFPYMYMHLKKLWFKHRPHKKHLYFKREFTDNTIIRLYYNLLPPKTALSIKKNPNLKHISFGIPEIKITTNDTLKYKNKLFTSHIVDKEIANKLNVKTSYVFDSEHEYYKDIQQSKYGITTKRAGWDCLRHYEIAANGAIICFKNLHLKPKNCAPHGLIPNINCLSYSNYQDLMDQINQINEETYNKLLQNSLKWVKSKTTIHLVRKLVKDSSYAL